jgi:hypothetical protein
LQEWALLGGTYFLLTPYPKPKIFDVNSLAIMLKRLAGGAVALKSGSAKNAESDFNRILDIDSNHPKPLHLRGIAPLMQGENNGAWGYFNRAIGIDPAYRAAYYSRAILPTSTKQCFKAAEHMNMIDQDDIMHVKLLSAKIIDGILINFASKIF